VAKNSTGLIVEATRRQIRHFFNYWKRYFKCMQPLVLGNNNFMRFFKYDSIIGSGNRLRRGGHHQSSTNEVTEHIQNTTVL